MQKTVNIGIPNKQILLRYRLIIFLLVLCYCHAHAQESVQQISYTIRVTLDDKHRALDGDLSLRYTNQSADTLREIWLQLWPNAYKNDRTAYSDRLLDSGVNDFYFSDKNEKGYINRLVFRAGDNLLVTQDDPRHIDLEKLILEKPLLPGRTITITTPFHVQLPFAFSGFGYRGKSFYLSHWHPAVAQYTAAGWNALPNVGQENLVAADYDVLVTVPARYSLNAIARISDSVMVDSMKTIHYTAFHTTDMVWSAEWPGTLHPKQKKTIEEEMVAVTPKILARKILPAIAYNVYDGFQIGVTAHNFQVPEKKLSWYASPTYATRSKTVTGMAGLNYNLPTGDRFKKISIGFNASRYSDLDGTDTLGKKVFGSFFKATPYVRLVFPEKDKHMENWIEFRTYLIGEKDLDYVQYSVDSFYYPASVKTKMRYLNQLTFSQSSYRSLYPYDWQLQLQLAAGFYRLNAEAHYFFNYAGGGGLQARLFAAKFGYIGQGDRSSTFRYQPKLTAVRGNEDYTYGNAFLGRNEFEGLASQQIMMRDGGLKLRTDNFQDLQGRSDNWIASTNLNTTLPTPLFPKGFPIRLFLDIGSYADAWKKGSPLPRFLYVGGIQLSLFKDLFNIYAPLLYSSMFRDNLKTVPELNRFFKRISFSVDVQRFNSRRISGNRISN